VAIFCVVAFSLAYNATRFFEITWEEREVEGNVTAVDITTSKLRQDPVYISVYITWLYTVFMYTVPFAGLAALNVLIYLDVRWVLPPYSSSSKANLFAGQLWPRKKCRRLLQDQRESERDANWIDSGRRSPPTWLSAADAK